MSAHVPPLSEVDVLERGQAWRAMHVHADFTHQVQDSTLSEPGRAHRWCAFRRLTPIPLSSSKANVQYDIQPPRPSLPCTRGIVSMNHKMVSIYTTDAREQAPYPR